MYNLSFTPIFIENDIRLMSYNSYQSFIFFIMKTKAKNVFDKITVILSIKR